MKVCIRCKVKSSNFYIKKNGYSESVCRPCQNARKRFVRKHTDYGIKVNELYRHRYATDQDFHDKKLARCARYRAENADKIFQRRNTEAGRTYKREYMRAYRWIKGFQENRS